MIWKKNACAVLQNDGLFVVAIVTEKVHVATILLGDVREIEEGSRGHGDSTYVR